MASRNPPSNSQHKHLVSFSHKKQTCNLTFSLLTMIDHTTSLYLTPTRTPLTGDYQHHDHTEQKMTTIQVLDMERRERRETNSCFRALPDVTSRRRLFFPLDLDESVAHQCSRHDRKRKIHTPSSASKELNEDQFVRLPPLKRRDEPCSDVSICCGLRQRHDPSAKIDLNSVFDEAC